MYSSSTALGSKRALGKASGLQTEEQAPVSTSSVPLLATLATRAVSLLWEDLKGPYPGALKRFVWLMQELPFLSELLAIPGVGLFIPLPR